MDISDTLAPNSDQLDAVDLAASGPRIFTVKSVSSGNAEQPVQVHLVEFPRGPWRPGKNMRRVLAHCWSTDASTWVGRKVELYCDPTVTFGKETPGGTRIARLSHIDREQRIPLLISRGKSATYTVKPLALDATTDVAASESPSRGLVSPEGAEAASSASPEPLLDAIKRQATGMSGEQKERFAIWLSDCGLGTKLGPIAERFGERARDLVGLVDRREMS